MALEDLTGASKFISDLVVTNPVGSTDTKSTLDDHARGTKNVLKNSFPNVNGACNPSPAEFNILVGITGKASADDILDNYPSGTVMLFQQTAAPTGYTKLLVDNDKALRVVTGTVGSGGTKPFTTTFGAGKTSDSYTLLAADIPAHDHGSVANHSHTQSHGSLGGSGSWGLSSFLALSGTTASSAAGGHTHTSFGGGGGHTHALSNFDLQYIDLILASKD